MGKLNNFRTYITEMEQSEGYSQKKRLSILLQEINSNFTEMSNEFSKDIILELSKNMKNAETAQKILGCLYNRNYNIRNAEDTEMSEIPQANRVIEEAVYELLEHYQDKEGKGSKAREKLLLDCYSKIAGKEGTTGKVIDKLSLEDIDSIIRAKHKKEGINSNELIDIIYKKAPTIIDTDEKKDFINLIENTILKEAKKNPDILENPEIFKIFEVLIQSYRDDRKISTSKFSEEKKEGNDEIFNKINEIFNLANNFLLKTKERYGEQSSKYRRLSEEIFLLKRQAYGYRAMSIQDLQKMFVEMELKKKIDTAESHLSEGIVDRESKQRENDDEDTKTANKMSASEKLSKISDAVILIQQKYPDKGISLGQVFVEENNAAFNGYYIIQMKGVHCYLLEKFNDKENSALYIVDSKDINNVFELIRDQRQIVKSHPLVTAVNHKDTQGISKDKSFAARICNAIEITMEHDKLSEMWDEAFELEGIIAKLSGTEDREDKIKKIEAQHSELSVLSELEKAYNEKLTEIEKQIERVEIIDKKRAEKEKKYLEKSERN